jgi:hypothetical protein
MQINTSGSYSKVYLCGLIKHYNVETQKMVLEKWWEIAAGVTTVIAVDVPSFHNAARR